MTDSQHVILSCTNRKRRDPSVLLRDVQGSTIPARASAWIDRVTSASPEAQAGKLYSGEYWQEGLSLAATASTRWTTEVSVVSAGLGLLHTDTLIPSYGATFTRRHPDSVVTDGSDAIAQRREWWAELARWRGLGPGRRRLADLAAEPGAHMLVCVGPDYVEAAADDLRAAHKVLGDDRMLVIGSGSAPEGLADVWVPSPGQLRMKLGGSMASSSVRTARAVIEQLPRRRRLNARDARAAVARLLKSADALPRFERQRLSDAELVRWIRRDARTNPGSRNKSAALRRLRDAGQACEQARFGELYAQAIGDAP